MLKTGSHVAGYNVLVFASRSLDQVLLGKFWGPASVGLYRQAGLLLQIPVSMFSYPISYVMTPALSALQGDPERYRTYYRKVLSFLAFGYMPLIAYLAVYSESLISLMLGEKWIASAWVLKALAVGAILEPIIGTCGIVMITTGKTKEYLYVGVGQSLLLCLCLAIGNIWGLMGVAGGYAVYMLLSLPPVVWFSFRGTPISQGMFYEALRRPAASCLMMSAILFGFGALVHPSSVFVELACSAVLAPGLYLGLYLLIPGGKQLLKEQISYGLRGWQDLKARICPAPATTPVGH